MLSTDWCYPTNCTPILTPTSSEQTLVTQLPIIHPRFLTTSPTTSDYVVVFVAQCRLLDYTPCQFLHPSIDYMLPTSRPVDILPLVMSCFPLITCSHSIHQQLLRTVSPLIPCLRPLKPATPACSTMIMELLYHSCQALAFPVGHGAARSMSSKGRNESNRYRPQMDRGLLEINNYSNID